MLWAPSLKIWVIHVTFVIICLQMLLLHLLICSIIDDISMYFDSTSMIMAGDICKCIFYVTVLIGIISSLKILGNVLLMYIVYCWCIYWFTYVNSWSQEPVLLLFDRWWYEYVFWFNQHDHGYFSFIYMHYVLDLEWIVEYCRGFVFFVQVIHLLVTHWDVMSTIFKKFGLFM